MGRKLRGQPGHTSKGGREGEREGYRKKARGGLPSNWPLGTQVRFGSGGRVKGEGQGGKLGWGVQGRHFFVPLVQSYLEVRVKEMECKSRWTVRTMEQELHCG